MSDNTRTVEPGAGWWVLLLVAALIVSANIAGAAVHIADAIRGKPEPTKETR